MKRIDVNWQANPKISACAHWMRAGGVICYPTEAVWGLGCDPFDPRAVETILQLKKRPWQKGLILVASSEKQLGALYSRLTDAQKAKVTLSWPGHTTWLLPHYDLIPPWVCGEHDKVAVRVSQHPVVRALCNQFGGPIVSTSANPAGMPPAQNGTKARHYFAGESLMYSPGRVGERGQPSTIKCVETDQVFR